MGRRWLRLLLAAVCYILLLSAMDIIFAALEGDVLDHLLAGLVEMVVFILTVFVAYMYVWRRGGLEWD